MLTLNETAHALSELCAAGATLGIIYNLFAAILVMRFEHLSRSRASNSQSRASKLPSVTVLKPLHGSEPGLFKRLASLCTQDYPEKVQLICGTQATTDAAIDLVRLLARQHPGTQIALVVDEQIRGTNRKVSNLVNMEPRSRHDLIVLSDSDILVDEQFIRRIVAELEHSRAGAVSCAYYGIALGGIWARVSALNINSQFLPNVIVALTFGATKPCFGSAIAMRKSTLKRIGGLKPFLDELADDYAIGRAVRSTGLDVVIPHFAVGHVCFEHNLQGFWERHMRSSRTIRSIDPVGYVGILFMHPLMLSVIAAVIGTSHPFTLLAVAFASRAVLTSSVERSFRLEPQRLWLLAVHDAISFAVFVSSFFGTVIAWRGSGYRILNDGTIDDES
jgi:ceramide glucosyltransferase